MLPFTLAMTADAQTYSVLYSFTGGADGANPEEGSLIADTAGNLYGTAYGGGGFEGTCGTTGCGVVFKLDPSGNEMVIYTFSGGSDGSHPIGGVVRDGAGNLYGTTLNGGSSNRGTIFRINPSGSETILHTFGNTLGGNGPSAGLAIDASGNLYGTTLYGGSSHQSCGDGGGCGVAFKLTRARAMTLLYDFSGGSDGGVPATGVIVDGSGNLYGTTLQGGTDGDGTVFELDPAGNETVLHSFAAGADGSLPSAGLFRDSAGDLYGTTQAGGSDHDAGTVFKVDAAGNESVLYSFSGGMDGGEPLAGLIRGASGTLYGTTFGGGASRCGTVFSLSPTLVENVLYSFGCGSDGAGPWQALLLYKGALYGTTNLGGNQAGGSQGFGVVFRVALK